MDLHCLYCNNKFVEKDISDVYTTTCGHIFHYNCLIEWLERSESCPHCKQRQRKQEVIKIYFTLADIPQKDSQKLTHKLDCLRNELEQKRDDINILKEEIAKLKTYRKELRQEFSNLKKLVEVKKGAIQFNQLAIDYHAKICKGKEKYKTEAVQLRKRLSNLQGINEIINGPDSELGDILIRSTLDKEALTLCVDTFVKNLEDSDRCNEKLDDQLVTYQNDLISLEEQLETLKAEHSGLLKDLEEDEEEECDELSEIKRNISRLIQHCCFEELSNLFSNKENLIENDENVATVTEKTASGPICPETTCKAQEFFKRKYLPPSPNLSLKKRCKTLVKKACNNPMQYLTSGVVELFDSDEDTEPVVATETERSGYFKLNNKLDHKKYKKLVQNKKLSAAAGGLTRKPKSSDVNKKMSYCSVLEIINNKYS